MTNTESRSAVHLDELPPWDDAETLDRLAQQLTAGDARSLAIYGLDSDQQTLVGLGPVERARRSRAAAEKPDSQRMPQSEPPGPFIANDEEPPPSFRARKLGGWTMALPALLVALAATVLLVRGRPSDPARQLSNLAAARQMPVIAKAASEQQRGLRLETASQAPRDAAEAPGDEATAAEEESTEIPTTQPENLPRESAPIDVSALPVKLPDVTPPAIVDRSGGTDASAGFINVTSSPPANVVLDGRPLGKAPRVVRVPAGAHTLVFIHPLYGRRSLSVNVRPGATTGASAEF
jgi:PEGA domain